ncbi:MAG: CotH kinase family protein [Verrucomicrobia bacterium]|nr:CotH kinase family protein [Verrucomicrobiota bacterium]
MKWNRLFWMLAATLVWRQMITTPACAATPEAEDQLYGTPKVLQLKIEIPQAQLEALRKEAKTYVQGTVREGDKVFTNVAVRLKGAASAQLIDKKPGLTLKFDEFATGQYFHNHNRIALNNASQDPSFLLEAIGGEIYRAAGVPAPRVTFARVDLNGRNAGLYVLVQPANRDFLSDYFKKTKGNFYVGDKSDVTEKLRLDGGRSAKDQTGLAKLAEVAREGNPNERTKKLGTLLDLDGFLSFLACEVFTGHRKGYMLDRNNYRVYHDPVSNRMVLMPDSLEDLFTKFNSPLAPECKGILARGVLESSEGQRLYRERMTKLLASAFKPEPLQSRVTDLAGKIRPALASDPNEAKTFDLAVARLRETIAQRAKFLEEELKKPAK